MAFKNVGAQFGAVAAAYGFDKVAEVIFTFALAVELLDNLPIITECDHALIAGSDKAIGAVPNVADVIGRLAIGFGAGERALGGQPPHFKDQFAVAEVKAADLSIGRLAIVFVTKPAADAQHRLGQFVFAQAPACLVHFMDALIT